MKKIQYFLLIICFLPVFLFAQEYKIKNVILMIPDGTSSNLLSLTRWYNYYQNSDNTRLAIDDYLCGYVKTHSSNAPIGDSAPTTSCYMTGQMSQTGYIATYPPTSNQDLMALDATMAYQPMTTLLEAARLLQHKSTGLVFKCEFPHATPADCSAHYYDRSARKILSKQMVHNYLDVVIGGGVKYLSSSSRQYLKEHDYTLIFDDKESLLQCQADRFWALFGDRNMPYCMDKDPEKTPSLTEMTRKAIQTLTKNENGFFLMVEGSMVDWAAHYNDAKAMITEMKEFDEAVAEVMRFANRDGETVVIILPDHSNSGVSMGNSNSDDIYDEISLDTIMKPLVNFKISLDSMVKLIKLNPVEQLSKLFLDNFNIALTDREIVTVFQASDYENSPVPKEQRKSGKRLIYTIAPIVNSHTFIGFTTFGHTGEDVFLAAYHPNHDIPIGFNTNMDIHRYLARQMKLENELPQLTKTLFVPHQQVFKNLKKLKISIDSIAPEKVVLTLSKGKNVMKIESYTNYITFNNKILPLSSVVVYVDKNRTFYLPESVNNFFE
ncbi:MAG: alkaline phosphatase [Bacteroidales bacterium]|jgi:alkaline phosphatase|nr:alkaline phosphatase [Bacteroidales bacterium]